MKDSIKTSVRSVTQDRPYMTLMGFVVLMGLVLAIWCVGAVQSTDIQVVTRYTAFGDVHFYKSVWWQLYSFAGFGIIVSALHTILMIRLHILGQRELGVALGWLTAVVFVIAAFYMGEILNLAFV